MAADATAQAGPGELVFTVASREAAEELFRHKVLALLRGRGLLSEERIELLLSWRIVARVLVQIPDPRRHLVRYYGAYSNRARGQRRIAEAQLGDHPSGEASEDPAPTPPERAALRRRWANLIRRVYEVDPLVCPRCGADMRVIGFIPSRA